MARCYWIDEVGELKFDGGDVVLSLVSAGETILLRGKRHTAFEGLARSSQRYAELEAYERIAEVVSMPKSRRGQKH